MTTLSSARSNKKTPLKNFAIISALGLVSGLPLALILSTLKASLLDNGFDLKTIGFFSLISIPYSLKLLVAPFVDSYKIPVLSSYLGQRRSWMIASQILLIIAIALLGFSVNQGEISKIAFMALSVAILSATQDIIIDAYRIELIKKEDQGLAASFYIYGYRIGLLISGAGALVLAEIYSWSSVYFIMSAIMVSAIFVTIIAGEIKGKKRSKKYKLITRIKRTFTFPLLEFFKRKHALIIVGFIIFFKLPDSFAGNLSLTFLLDIGYSKVEVAAILKTFGLFATLFGVFVGGVLVKKIGLHKTLWVAGFMQMFSNLAFCYIAKIGVDVSALYPVIFIENFSGGIGDVALVAYLSSLCKVGFSATQYALLASLASVTRSLVSSSSGIYAQMFGWYNFFLFSAILGLPALIFLFWLSLKIFVKK